MYPQWVEEICRTPCRCHGVPMTRRNDRTSGWRCSTAHYYAVDRHRVRSRIERKRQRIALLEAQLAEKDTR